MNAPQYKLLDGFDGQLGEYEVCSVRQEDALPIMHWRNAQIDALRQREALTEEQQLSYFRKNVFPSFSLEQPPMVILSYLKSGQLIGYGGIVHLNWEAKRGEVSFLLDPDRTKDKASYGQDLNHFLTLLKRLAFDHLQLNRLTTEAYGNRPWHVEAIEANGFRHEGILRQHALKGDQLVDAHLHACLREEHREE